MSKTIYDLKLHEFFVDPNRNLSVLRVAGGWLYKFWDFNKQDYYPQTTFVPFNNEFQTKECLFRWKEGNQNVVCGEKMPCSKHRNYKDGN